MNDFHAAAKAVEMDGIGCFWRARELIGEIGALALVVTHLRRNLAKKNGGWTADPDIASAANGYLEEELPVVYAMFQQNPMLFYSYTGYCLDNFAAFQVVWRRMTFATAEHAYQAAKYINSDETYCREPENNLPIARLIERATSPHEAKKLARSDKFTPHIRKDWDAPTKLAVMEEILRAKRDQHEYIRTVLRASRGMLLVEDSNKDPFWGRGEFWTGENHQGRIWMKLRDELP